MESSDAVWPTCTSAHQTKMDSPSLHRRAHRLDGTTDPTVPSWHVFRQAVSVSLTDLQRMREKALSRPHQVVFNPDKLRIQRPILADDPLVVSIRQELLKQGFLNGREMHAPVVLHSFAGCQQQPWHLDFDPDLQHQILPLGILLALQSETRLKTKRETVCLDAGDLLVFDGDLVHAGAAYNVENTRIHAYLNPIGEERPGKNTFLVP